MITWRPAALTLVGALGIATVGAAVGASGAGAS